ncbi:MAG: nicotinate-nucleotide adenylyltransferase [Planctomycetota bacterium]
MPSVNPNDRLVGILGGTFDPVHCGHIALAEAGRDQLGLDRVYFVPAPLPPHKAGAPLAKASERLEMVRLAIVGAPKLSVNALEFERQGPSYSIDTVRAFRRMLGAEAELFFLIGADTIGELPTWKEIGELARLCTFAAAGRQGWDAGDLGALAGAIDEESIERMRRSTIRMSPIEVSSTEIRARVRRGESIEGLVPGAVARYIAAQKLYR